MAPLCCAANFDPYLSLDCALALHPGAIQRKEGIKFCHLATLVGRSVASTPDEQVSFSLRKIGGKKIKGREGSGQREGVISSNFQFLFF